MASAQTKPIAQQATLSWSEEVALQLKVVWRILQSMAAKKITDDAVAERILNLLCNEVVWHPAVNKILLRERGSKRKWPLQQDLRADLPAFLTKRIAASQIKVVESRELEREVHSLLDGEAMFRSEVQPVEPEPAIVERSEQVISMFFRFDRTANWWIWLRALEEANHLLMPAYAETLPRSHSWTLFSRKGAASEDSASPPLSPWILGPALGVENAERWPPAQAQASVEFCREFLFPDLERRMQGIGARQPNGPMESAELSRLSLAIRMFRLFETGLLAGRLAWMPTVAHHVERVLPPGWRLDCESRPSDSTSANWRRQPSQKPPQGLQSAALQIMDTAGTRRYLDPGQWRDPPRAKHEELCQLLDRLNRAQRKLPEADCWLDGLLGELAQSWRTFDQLEDWWKSGAADADSGLTPGGQLAEVWCRLHMLPAHAEIEGGRRLLFQKLRSSGIKLESLPIVPDESLPSVWHVPAPEANTRRAVVERIQVSCEQQSEVLDICPLPVPIPDGHVSLSLAGEALQKCAPLLIRLRQTMPELKSLCRLDSEVWRLALAARREEDADAARVVRDFANEAFHEWLTLGDRESHSSPENQAIQLLWQLLRTLLELDPIFAKGLPLPLEPETLQPDLGAISQRDDIRVRWETVQAGALSQPHGTLLRARCPAARDGMIDVTLRLGSEFDALRNWLALQPRVPGHSPLTNFLHNLASIPLRFAPSNPNPATEVAGRIDAEINKLFDDLGRHADDFDSLIKSAIRQSAANPATEALALLARHRQWSCYPPVTFNDAGTVTVDLSNQEAPWFRLQADDSKPGTFLTHLSKFARRAEDAIGVISDGAAVTSEVIRLSEHVSRACEPFDAPLRASVSEFKAATFQQQRGRGDFDVPAVTRPLRELLAASIRTSPSMAPVVLPHLEDWIRYFGYVLTPAEGSADGSADAERSRQKVPARFDTAERGKLVVECFGLDRQQGDRREVVEAPKIFRSAGPEPPGYRNLLAQAQQFGEKWRQRVEDFPVRIADRSGERFAAQLFSEIHEQRPNDPRLSGLLEPLLVMLEREWKIVPFQPTQENEHPKEWLRNVATTPNRRGLVRRVICPGLMDVKRMWLPATVELE
jgi:hypothetical protein